MNNPMKTTSIVVMKALGLAVSSLYVEIFNRTAEFILTSNSVLLLFWVSNILVSVLVGAHVIEGDVVISLLHCVSNSL